MKIEKVHIKGFRNFDDVVVELGEKTLIFGPNDSGKTNFLHALRFFSIPASPLGISSLPRPISTVEPILIEWR